jgi:predicted neutral ceramidase superfamily lipid hydrolase
MIHHLGGNEKFLAFFIKKLRNNVGLGQMLRCLLNDKELSKWFLEEHKFFMAYILYYILGLILIIIYPLFKLTTLVYVWVIGLLILLLINIIKEQNIKNSIIYMFTAIPQGIYFTIGFLRPVKDPDNFPKDVIVIK